MREGEFIHVEWCVNLKNKSWLKALLFHITVLMENIYPTIYHEILVKLNLREYCGENLTSLTNTDIYSRRKREVCCP